MVSYNKMNKKSRRKIDNKKRNLWNVSPVTKIVPSKKVYNRKGKYGYESY